MRWLLLLAISSSALACSHGNCRSQKPEEKPAVSATATAGTKPGTGDSMNQVSKSERVKVYKPDGSLQCGQGKAVPLSEMQAQLGNIKVYSSVNRNDGMMRIQVCGAPTGNINLYEIDRKDLPAALKKGFKEWMQD